MTMEPVFFSLKVYAIVGVVSFICAGIIWCIVRLLSAWSEKEVKQAMATIQAPQPISAATDSAQPALSAVTTKPSLSASGGIPPAHLAIIAAAAVQCQEVPRKHLAIIAAAAHVMFGTSTILRIDHINRRSAWVAGGRLTHQTSHNSTRRR